MAENKQKQQLRRESKRKRGRGNRSNHYFLASYAYTQYTNFSQTRGGTQNHFRVTRSRNISNAESMIDASQLQAAPRATIRESDSFELDTSTQESDHSHSTMPNESKRDASALQNTSVPGGDENRRQESATPTAPTLSEEDGRETPTDLQSSSGSLSQPNSRDNHLTVQSVNAKDLDQNIAQSQPTGSTGVINSPMEADGKAVSLGISQSSAPKESSPASHLQLQVKLSGDQEGKAPEGASDDIRQTLIDMNSRLKKLDTLEDMSLEMKADLGKIHSTVGPLSEQMLEIQAELKKAEQKWEESEGTLNNRMLKVEKGCQKIEKAWDNCKVALKKDLGVVQSSLDENSSRLLDLENKFSEGGQIEVDEATLQKLVDAATEKKINKLQKTFREEVRQEVTAELEANKKEQERKQAYEKLKEQAFAKRHNLILFGIPETPSIKTDKESVLQFFSTRMGTDKPNILTLHRLGSFDKNKHRPIVIKFANLDERWDIWKKRGTILHDPENPVWIQEDLLRKLREDNRVLLRILKTAKSMPNSSYDIRIQDFQIVLEGNFYDIYNLHLLPPEISTKMAFTPYSDSVVVFFTKHSPLSNHFPCSFVIESITFNCIEQYLAVQRAFLAKNKSLARKAMETSNPAEHKNILNLLRGHQPDVWREKADDIIKTALRAKFFQNRDLSQFLMDTYPRLIGEASKNEVWGIGLSLDNKDVLDSSKWRKEGNLLGISLAKVRDELLAEKNRNSETKSQSPK